ncbi:GNAT family N-acetyltransferase [Corticibacter populi]|uniref:GNAT family N-acetyltransferase n=1 Tax=Corticibacter populi TaxID=1550736 RepID=A0A3M6QRR1_9BURK|nr:GNAT family N-acetyltransferase [Corticibacter populi]RMX05653.1 GNAT family N-acetyltransferase [Corticibacter populi]RZS31068.1 acetyltransferase (GNAT) family protein [Corticibacter populi]
MLEIILADLRLPNHANALVELLDAYARDPMGGSEPLPQRTREQLPAALAARPGAHVILAFVDGQPAGLLNAIEGFSTFACQPILNVHDVAVAPAFRGQGISRRLFERAEQIAREIGACKLTLEVLEGNRHAQAAYRRFGFAPYALDPALGSAMFWQKPLAAAAHPLAQAKAAEAA